jgi:competence ComEA-like helix-hairpin-helix protein
MASRFVWTISQRRALIVLLLVVLAELSIQAYLRPVYYSDPPPEIGARTSELADRIDPNTASAAELSSIPNVGPAHAAAIVAYREAFVAAHPGRRAFEQLSDLTHIRGIGKATADKLAAHFTFDAPTTSPAP